MKERRFSPLFWVYNREYFQVCIIRNFNRLQAYLRWLWQIFSLWSGLICSYNLEANHALKGILHSELLDSKSEQYLTIIRVQIQNYTMWSNTWDSFPSQYYVSQYSLKMQVKRQRKQLFRFIPAHLNLKENFNKVTTDEE